MRVVGILWSTLSGDVGEDVLLIASCVASPLFGPWRWLGLSTQKREILKKSEGAGLSKAVRLQSWGDMQGEALPGHPKALHTLSRAGSWPCSDRSGGMHNILSIIKLDILCSGYFLSSRTYFSTVLLAENPQNGSGGENLYIAEDKFLIFPS